MGGATGRCERRVHGWKVRASARRSHLLQRWRPAQERSAGHAGRAGSPTCRPCPAAAPLQRRLRGEIAAQTSIGGGRRRRRQLSRQPWQVCHDANSTLVHADSEGGCSAQAARSLKTRPSQAPRSHLARGSAVASEGRTDLRWSWRRCLRGRGERWPSGSLFEQCWKAAWSTE